MQKIVPFLWFKDNAEEAMNFYISVFPNSRVMATSHYPEGSPMPTGTFMTGAMELNGSPFMLLNGGTLDDFNHSISFVVNCETQEEIDSVWNAFLQGGKEEQCGWIRDKYGVAWQVVPTKMGELMSTGTPEQIQRTMAAMLNMVKLDIAALQAAHDGN